MDEANEAAVLAKGGHGGGGNRTAPGRALMTNGCPQPGLTADGWYGAQRHDRTIAAAVLLAAEGVGDQLKGATALVRNAI